jgi:bacterioferritin-associated ferredoxin
VSSVRIAAAVRAHALGSVAEVALQTRAGSGCGTCHVEIEEIVRVCRGERIPDWARIDNRSLCHDETQRRVEASLDFGVLPQLSRGQFVELVALEGLRVDLHLLPKRDPAIEQWIADRLRKLVCSELLVSFV